MGVVTTLLPVIGVPLPLVSYGGSSLVATLTGIGIVLAFARAARPDSDRPAQGREPAADETDQRRGVSRVSSTST
jgi:cell division protein FtsW